MRADGDTRVRVSGFLLERLLNRALGAGIALRRVRRTGARSMEIDAGVKDADALCRMAADANLDAAVLRARGPSVWVAKMKARATLPVGLLLAAFLLYAYAGRVWFVDVRAVEGALPAGASQAVADALGDMGVSPGAKPPDEGETARLLMSRFPEYAYVGVARRGAYVEVSLASVKDAPEVYNPDAARDLVAARDGVAVSVTVLAGKANVKVGDTVKKGDTLILGEERVSDECTRGVRAAGSVRARVWREAEASEPRFGETVSYTGRTRVAATLVTPFGRVPLRTAEPFVSGETAREVLPVVGMFVPVYVERITYREVAREKTPRDAEAERTARANALTRAASGETGSLLRVWTETRFDSDRVFVRAVCEFVEDIAVAR